MLFNSTLRLPVVILISLLFISLVDFWLKYRASVAHLLRFVFLCYCNEFESYHAVVPGRLAQSVGHLTRKSGVLGSIPVWQHTFVSLSAFSGRAVVSYWGKYVHKVLVNRLGGLSLPRKSVVRLTDRPDMTLDVYRGRKTTVQQQPCSSGILHTVKVFYCAHPTIVSV